jgi:hypothetical protein
MNWVKIADQNVRMIWACTDEDCECNKEVETIIEPDWYQQNGTPICECGQDMDYLNTEIDTGTLNK